MREVHPTLCASKGEGAMDWKNLLANMMTKRSYFSQEKEGSIIQNSNIEHTSNLLHPVLTNPITESSTRNTFAQSTKLQSYTRKNKRKY